MKIDERQKIIAISREGLRNSRLVQLGAKALDIVFKYAVASPLEDIVVLRTPKGDIVGFALISYAPGSFGRRLLCHGPFLACFVANIWRLRWGISSVKTPKMTMAPNIPEAIFICIDAPYRGKDWGGRLIGEIENVLKQNNVTNYFVKTEADNNQKVIDFYLKAGFKNIPTASASTNFFLYFIKNVH